MSHPPLFVRQLSLSETEGLSTLFRKERNPSSQLDFWQERGDRFLRIYDHHRQGPPIFWGAFQESQLIGVTGVIPTLAQNPYTENKGQLHTDFFVSPEHRSRTASVQLILAFKDWVVAQGSQTPFFLGVEHNWLGLEACNRIAQKFNCRFNFPLQSTLTQIFLTSKPSFPASTEKLQRVRLIDAPQSLQQQWIEKYGDSRKHHFLSPIVTSETLQKLLHLDPEAELIWLEDQGEILAGTLLLDPSSARKFLWSGKPNLVIARLQKFSPSPFQAGSEIRMGLVSLSLGEGANLRQVFEGLMHRAWEQKFHALAFRDEDQNLLRELSLDVFHFPRRALVAHGPEFSRAAELEKDLQQGRLSIRMETTFL